MSGWQAGAAVVPFPVAPGTPLAGYAARSGAALGTRDGLAVAALVLVSGGRRLAIVAADVIAIDVALVHAVAAATGLARSEVVICASHTHSGPAGIVPRLHAVEPPGLDHGLRAAFVAACAAAIRTAQAAIEPVELLVGAVETAGLAANRNDPTGPFDPRLTVLAARRIDASYLALVVHFACHPTILGADSRAVSADFPGALRRSLAAALGPGSRPPVVLFANGAAGDISTRFTRRGQDAAEVDRVGTALAAAAVGALASARPVHGAIRHRRLTVPLPPRSRAEIEAALAAGLAAGGAVTGDLPPAERRRIETRAQGAALLARLADIDPGAIPGSLELVAWALGDLALLAVPGELFASLGARIVAGSRWPVTLILGYANGHAGYLADQAAYDAGTYEALASPYAPGMGERVAEAAAALLAGLDGDGADAGAC